MVKERHSLKNMVWRH